MSITRDTRPVDPEDRDRRQLLLDLAQSLRGLHKTLLESVKKDYEKTHGPIVGQFRLFQLVIQDPFFAWLRPLSAEMALIDERIDDKTKLELADLAGVRRALEALLDSNESLFAGPYRAKLASDKTVKPEHKGLQKLLEQMPKSAIA